MNDQRNRHCRVKSAHGKTSRRNSCLRSSVAMASSAKLGAAPTDSKAPARPRSCHGVRDRYRLGVDPRGGRGEDWEIRSLSSPSQSFLPRRSCSRSLPFWQSQIEHATPSVRRNILNFGRGFRRSMLGNALRKRSMLTNHLRKRRSNILQPKAGGSAPLHSVIP